MTEKSVLKTSKNKFRYVACTVDFLCLRLCPAGAESGHGSRVHTAYLAPQDFRALRSENGEIGGTGKGKYVCRTGVDCPLH